jgi:hypothetical protein
MIECAYGKKFPELILYFDGNVWIESYSVKNKKKLWRNKKTGEMVSVKPNLAQFKNTKLNVPLPTRPFIYSSKAGCWSSPSFENGDEDYFDELPIGGYTNHDDRDLRRISLSKDMRKSIQANKDMRRISTKILTLNTVLLVLLNL